MNRRQLVGAPTQASAPVTALLAETHPMLETRDLVHLACCQRRKADGLATFDRGLAAAWTAFTAGRGG